MTGHWLLDERWDSVPRLDLNALLSRCTRVVMIGSGWQGQAAVGATLADISGSGMAVHVVDGGADLDDRTLVIAPATLPAIQQAALECGSLLLEYPLMQENSTAQLPWSRMRLLAPSLLGLRAKQDVLRGLDGPLSTLGSRVVEVLEIPDQPELAARVRDAVVPARGRTDIAPPFDAMLEDGHDDPWRLDRSPYERRRLELILACLGRPHYRRILEIGCATGQLSVELAKRADEVVAMDASAAALAVAKDRAGGCGIRWVLGAVPQDFPDGGADLILISEVGYFLDGPDLVATLRAARSHLRPDGEIVLANWRRPTERIPLDGNIVQEQAAAMIDLPRRAHYEDIDLIIDVWGAPVSVYDEYADPSPPCE